MENNNSKRAKIISDTICGALMLVTILVYIILGVTISWWHPGWIIIVSAAVADGIISLITNMVCALKYPNEDKDKNDNSQKND